MQLRQWKQRKYGAAVAIPGSWYPDARFQRLAPYVRTSWLSEFGQIRLGQPPAVPDEAESSLLWLRPASPIFPSSPAWPAIGAFFEHRLALVKAAMPKPASLQEAVAQAVHVLNTVSVPEGAQPGKDMSEADADHRTEWAAIWDHKNAVVYWRAVSNQNLARLRLQDAGLEVGGQQRILLVRSPKLPWFSDAAAALRG